MENSGGRQGSAGFLNFDECFIGVHPVTLVDIYYDHLAVNRCLNFSFHFHGLGNEYRGASFYDISDINQDFNNYTGH